jgi:hypothetical protein
MIALREDRVRAIYEAHGLEVEYICFGEWCGRPLAGAGYQDEIVARKADRLWEPGVVADVGPEPETG